MELAILMPSLNEAETIALCIEKARLGLQRAGVAGEILISEKLGARVVAMNDKGYGNFRPVCHRPFHFGLNNLLSFERAAIF